MHLHVQGSGAGAATVRARGGREPARGPRACLRARRTLRISARARTAGAQAGSPPQCGCVCSLRGAGQTGGTGARRQQLLKCIYCAAPVAAPMPVVARSSCAAEHEQQKPWLAGTRAPAASSTNPQVGLADAGPSSQAVSVLPPVRTSSCTALGAGLRHGRTPSWPAAVLAHSPGRLPRHPVATSACSMAMRSSKWARLPRALPAPAGGRPAPACDGRHCAHTVRACLPMRWLGSARHAYALAALNAKRVPRRSRLGGCGQFSSWSQLPHRLLLPFA